MSVRKEDRTESKAQFVYNSYQIVTETMNFLSRLSSRYSRILTDDTKKLAFEVMDNCIKANDIKAVNMNRLRLREQHTVEARAALSALDVHLKICRDTLLLNPAGAFIKASGKPVQGGEAIEKIDKMSQALGELIKAETNLLTGQLDYLKDIEKKLNSDSTQSA